PPWRSGSSRNDLWSVHLSYASIRQLLLGELVAAATGARRDLTKPVFDFHRHVFSSVTAELQLHRLRNRSWLRSASENRAVEFGSAPRPATLKKCTNCFLFHRILDHLGHKIEAPLTFAWHFHNSHPDIDRHPTLPKVARPLPYSNVGAVATREIAHISIDMSSEAEFGPPVCEARASAQVAE